MKKVLSVVLAVAMVLACVASLAFVLEDQTGSVTATNSALKVEDFHVTDEAAMTTGLQVYGELADLDGGLYAKNQIIRFALDLAVYNPNYLASGVEHATPGSGNPAQLIIESDTVDFALNQQQPYASMVLYKPLHVAGIVSTNLMVGVSNATAPGATSAIYTPVVSSDHGTMKVDVRYVTATSAKKPLSLQDASNGTRFDKDLGLVLLGVSDNVSTIKTDYTLVFTGVTKGDTTQEGRVTVSMQDKAGDTFATDGYATITKNNHTYRIKKYYANNVTPNSGNTYLIGALKDAWGQTPLKWTSLYGRTQYSELYDVDAVGYEVFVLLSNTDGKVETEGDNIWGIVGMFETEQVRYGKLFEDQHGKDVPGTGLSLGLDYFNGTTYDAVSVNPVPVFGTQYFVLGTNKEVYRAGAGADGIFAGSFDSNLNLTGINETAYMTARTALDQFMSDFGFGFGSGYTYKIADANFTNEATYEELGRATYNGNAIVIEQPEEDPDVEEPTDNDEVPDEGDIDEELPDEGDIDEEPIPDEPVPETGDASAAVAVALTAAALVAAAGLAVVLKKAR